MLWGVYRDVKPAIRVLVVDDHPTARRGLELVFDDADGIELVGSARSGEEALIAVLDADPDIALLDIRLPGINGVTTIERITQRSPGVKSLVYSAYGDRRLLTDAIAAGAIGYVLKRSPVPDLLRAVRTVAAGEPYIDPSLSPLLLMESGAPGAPLAEREREVLQLLAAGLHTDEVAARIGLSAETVKSDTKRAVQCLEATGRVHAVANALRRALIE